jgi:4-amino-4-deoxy-L-arabinose transferase-like glycosyltransferase
VSVPRSRIIVEESPRLTTSFTAVLVALLGVAAVIYALPLAERALWNQDEARVALLADETLRHGLRLPVYVRGEAYLNKPPLYFWSVALVCWPLGRVSDVVAPLPSLVSALATLLGTFAIGRMLGGSLTGLVALAVLGTSPGFYLHSHQVLPDMMLTAWLTWMLYFLIVALRAEQHAPTIPLIGLYACLAGALWTKGSPALLALPTSVAATVSMRGWRGLPALRPLWGLGAVAVVILPWAIPYALTPGRGSGQTISVGTALSWYLDRYERASSVPLTGGIIWFLPWAFWLVPVALWWWISPDRAAWRPLAAWTLVAVVLLALSVQQRPRYSLTLYPVFALLVAGAATSSNARARTLQRVHLGLVVGLAVLALAVGVWMLSSAAQPQRVKPLASLLDISHEGPLLVAGFLAALAMAFRELRAGTLPGRALLYVAAGLGWVLLVEGWSYPARLNEQMPIRAFAAEARPLLSAGVPIVGYPDANLAFDFYLQHPVIEVAHASTVLRVLEEPVSGTFLIREAAWEKFRGAAHNSWCPLARVGAGLRSYVLVGACR